MEVETSNSFQTQDVCDNDQNRQRFDDAGIPNNDGLQLDFESEFSDFLSRDLPSNNNELNPAARRSSNSGSSSTNSNNQNATHSVRLEYNLDGTVNCCDINYGTLVSMNV